MYVFSTLKHNGTKAEFDETEGCEESGRTGADNDGLLATRDIGIFNGREVGLRRRFVDIDINSEVDINGALTRVDAAATDA